VSAPHRYAQRVTDTAVPFVSPSARPPLAGFVINDVVIDNREISECDAVASGLLAAKDLGEISART